MSNKTESLFLFLAAIFLSSLSQVLLKKSAEKIYADKKKEYLNRLVVTAYTLFLFSTLLIAFAYKSLPLSIGAILETTGYIWIAVLGRPFFKERLNKRKCTGLLIIILGIIIFQF